MTEIKTMADALPSEPLIRIEWNIQGQRGSTDWHDPKFRPSLQHLVFAANQIHGRDAHWIAKQEPKP